MSAELRRQVAMACRVIALEGYVDLTLGHVSAREPGSRTIWIKRKGPALDEVMPEDVIALDLDDPDALLSPEFHLESVMHTEIYRVRPDADSVIHGHPIYGTALGSTDAELLMLTHDAVLFVDGSGDFDEGPDLVLYYKYLMVLEGNPDYEHHFNQSDALSPSQRELIRSQWELFRQWWSSWPGSAA